MEKIKKEVFSYIQILIGILLASIGLKAFLLPNGFLDGGVTGIAILLSEMMNVDISLLIIFCSIPFLVLAWFSVSRKIFFKSIIAIISLAFFIHLENFGSVTEDKLLISIFGGLFLGAGIGLSIKNGAVMDGSEILGIFINQRFGLSIGKIILVFNVILFSFTAYFLSLEVAMYSVLTYLITAKIIDLMIEGFEDYVGLMIVSEKPLELEEALYQEIRTGITVYKGLRGYGNKGMTSEVDIIHLVINRIDIRKTYNSIEKIDSKAFIIEFDVNNIQGGVYQKYLSKDGIKKLAPSTLKFKTA